MTAWSLRARNFVAFIALTLTLPTSAAAQTQSEAVAPLPTPKGPFPVGTSVVYLTDSSRSDQDFPGGRPVTLQLWYPSATRAGRTAPYLMEDGLRSALHRNQYYGVDSVALDHWAKLTTHSYLNALPSAGKHPFVAFSVGLGVIRGNYTSIAEELASHGYVVALVESPLQGLMTLPNGTTVIDSAGRYNDVAEHRHGVAAWSHDISFVLDELVADGAPKQLKQIGTAIDTTQIGAMGHSSGGLVAITACENDRRVRACVNMDGGVADPDRQPLADFVSAGVTKPTLFLRSQPLYDDTTLARRGMTREQWVKRGDAGRREFEALVARSRGPLWVASVAGTGHFSFSDAPFVMPSAISRFGGRIIAPERGLIVITAALKAFFERELLQHGEGLTAVAERMPELTVVRTGR